MSSLASMLRLLILWVGMQRLSVEGGIVVEDGQGEGAGDAEVEEPDAEEVIEEVVEVGLEAVVALCEGHSCPDYDCSQPVDVSVHAYVGP